MVATTAVAANTFPVNPHHRSIFAWAAHRTRTALGGGAAAADRPGHYSPAKDCNPVAVSADTAAAAAMGGDLSTMRASVSSEQSSTTGVGLGRLLSGTSRLGKALKSRGHANRRQPSPPSPRKGLCLSPNGGGASSSQADLRYGSCIDLPPSSKHTPDWGKAHMHSIECVSCQSLNSDLGPPPSCHTRGSIFAVSSARRLSTFDTVTTLGSTPSVGQPSMIGHLLLSALHRLPRRIGQFSRRPPRQPTVSSRRSPLSR